MAMSESEGEELPSELPLLLCQDMALPACLNINEQLAYKIKLAATVCYPACHINIYDIWQHSF